MSRETLNIPCFGVAEDINGLKQFDRLEGRALEPPCAVSAEEPHIDISASIHDGATDQVAAFHINIIENNDFILYGPVSQRFLHLHLR